MGRVPAAKTKLSIQAAAPTQAGGGPDQFVHSAGRWGGSRGLFSWLCRPVTRNMALLIDLNILGSDVAYLTQGPRRKASASSGGGRALAPNQLGR